MSNLVDVSSVKPAMLRASVGCETANAGCAMVHLFRYHTAALPLHFILLQVAALLPIASQLPAKTAAKSNLIVITAACARLKRVQLARAEIVRSKATTSTSYRPTSILVCTQHYSSCDQVKTSHIVSWTHMGPVCSKTREIALSLASRAKEEKHAGWLYPCFCLPTSQQPDPLS